MEETELRVAILVDGFEDAIAQAEFHLAPGEMAERIHVTELHPTPGDISERVYQLVPSDAASDILEYRLIHVERAD